MAFVDFYLSCAVAYVFTRVRAFVSAVANVPLLGKVLHDKEAMSRAHIMNMVLIRALHLAVWY